MLTAELNVKRTEIQLRQQKRADRGRQPRHQQQHRRRPPAKGILQKQMEQQQSMLAQASVRAPFAGMLTALLAEEGASVATGQLVARVSELNNYRVEATLSDFHARSIETGQPVRVEQNGKHWPAGSRPFCPKSRMARSSCWSRSTSRTIRNCATRCGSTSTSSPSRRPASLLADAGAAFNGRGQPGLRGRRRRGTQDAASTWAPATASRSKSSPARGPANA
jgi:HlyD family secretion protein